MLVAVPNDLKLTKINILADSNRSVRLQVAQVPRSLKLAIFVLTMATIDIQTDHFTPCACTWGNYMYMYVHVYTCTWTWMDMDWAILTHSTMNQDGPIQCYCIVENFRGVQLSQFSPMIT